MKVIVIGAGIVGSSVAFRLAEAGAEVEIIEAGRVGGGTSSVSYAWVNACEKMSRRDYFELNFAGVKAHCALVEEFASAYWLHRPGVLQWANAGAEATGLEDGEGFDKVARAKEWGYPAEPASIEEVLAMEPEIAPEAVGNARVIHYPQDGWADAPSYAGALVTAAQRRHGARLRSATKVERVVLEKGRVRGVEIAGEGFLAADVVVNCAGRWSLGLTAERELAVPLAPTIGIVAYTEPTPLTLRKGLRTPDINLRPDGGGRLLLRSNELDGIAAKDDSLLPVGRADVTHPLAQELLRRAIAVLPSLAGTKVEAVRTAIRPIPKDGYPAVGPLPGIEGYYIAVTHSGVTLGPFLGLVARDEIVGGKPNAMFDNFRPARFLA